ncbi:uncharacterized protein LOC121979681 [Zingiber officinale]|uniref:uncharacterized protein LOC121979681 n=1 Tax=Zingiber officinale TaxID=94328 RepID=UPI001C4ADEFF|nr:uncharacterized protein LOC121979681 [Zingiber officinale]
MAEVVLQRNRGGEAEKRRSAMEVGEGCSLTGRDRKVSAGSAGDSDAWAMKSKNDGNKCWKKRLRKFPLSVLFSQTLILKVIIHCDGCRLQVRKILHRTEGVFSVSIDVEEQKVTVSGDVDAATLIRKLNRAGKHAEPWPVKASKEDQRPNQQKQGKKPVCNTVKKQSHKSFRNQKHELSSSSSDDEYDSDDEEDDDDDDYDLRSLNSQLMQIDQQRFPMMVNMQQACQTQSPSMVMQENGHLQPQMMYLRSPAMAAAYTGYYCYQSPCYLNDQVDDGYQCYYASGNGDSNVCSIM